MDAEYEKLFSILSESGCAKKQTAAGTYVGGEWRYAVNRCEYVGEACPRLNLPSGTGYELCKARHAEATLAENLKANGESSDGVVWLVGHYWACEPCASAIKSVGTKEIRIREIP